jgi:hypothetical protein
LGGSAGEITNDLGYRVRITEGYLVTRDIELVPCDPKPPAALSLLDLPATFLGARPAWAGHSGVADPSATKRAQVESLLDRQALEIGTVEPGAQSYCRLHYLVARADSATAGLPADTDMVDQSLDVSGSFARDESGPQTFRLRTAIANGVLVDLRRPGSSHPTPLDTGRESATIVVRRRFDTLFHRIDFAAMDEKRMARELLQNVIEGVEIELQVEPHG